jgi:hypothetical protein
MIHIGLYFCAVLALFVIWQAWDIIKHAPLDPPWSEDEQAQREADWAELP